MRAAQLFGRGDIRYGLVAEPPAVEGDEVLVAVEAAGICGSDIHNFRTGQWISRSPSIPGHEVCGRVVRSASSQSRFRAGDLVVADSRVWCGECSACTSGNAHLCARLGFVGEVCDGGFAELLVLPERLLLKADPSLAPAVASTAEPLAVALHAVNRLAITAGAPVLVTGCGMIGALAALLLSRDHDVRIADRNAARAALVADVTGARVVSIDGAGMSGVQGIVEATGSTAVLAEILRFLPGGARLALVGIFHGTLPLDPTVLVERELAILGCHAFRDELPQALAMLPQLSDRIARFIAPPIEIAAIPEAYRRIAAGEEISPKTVIRP